MNYSTFIYLAHEEKWCIDYLIACDVFKGKMQCPNCQTELDLNRDALSFRCQKSTTIAVGKKEKEVGAM